MSRTMIIAALALLCAGAAVADEAGDEVINKMDGAMTRATDQMFYYQVINEEPGREPKVMEMRVHIKGEMRITEFFAPGDMKGTKALVRAADQMWIFLPAYSKVRRVASHMTSGGFMGTTFSNADISTITYGALFTGTLNSETDTEWVVEATPREGVDVTYGKLLFTIDKEHLQPTEIQYFSEKGVHTKTETRTGYTCTGEICNAASMKMTDHSRNDASTELVRTEWEVNTGIGDDVFSVRSLQ